MKRQALILIDQQARAAGVPIKFVDEQTEVATLFIGDDAIDAFATAEDDYAQGKPGSESAFDEVMSHKDAVSLFDEMTLADVAVAFKEADGIIVRWQGVAQRQAKLDELREVIRKFVVDPVQALTLEYVDNYLREIGDASLLELNKVLSSYHDEDGREAMAEEIRNRLSGLLTDLLVL